MVLNEKLLEVMGDDDSQDRAFAHANDVPKNAVGGVSDFIHFDDARAPGLQQGQHSFTETGRLAARGAKNRPASTAYADETAVSSSRAQAAPSPFAVQPL